MITDQFMLVFSSKSIQSIWLQLYYLPSSSTKDKKTDWKMPRDERSNQINKRWITKHFLLTSFQCFCLHGCNNNQPHSSIYPLLQKLLCLLYWKERKGCVSILIRKKIIILFQLNEQYNWHALIIINRSTHIEWYK